LFSSLFGVPRLVAGPICGFIVDAVGWKAFFWLTIASGAPGLILLARFVPLGTREPTFRVEPPTSGVPLGTAGLVWVAGRRRRRHRDRRLRTPRGDPGGAQGNPNRSERRLCPRSRAGEPGSPARGGRLGRSRRSRRGGNPERALHRGGRGRSPWGTPARPRVRRDLALQLLQRGGGGGIRRVELERARERTDGESVLPLVLVAQAQVVVRRRIVGIRFHHLLEAVDRVVDVLLALADDAQVIPRDDVLRVDGDGALEGARRLVEPRLVEERDGQPEVGRSRGRIQLDRLARRRRALAHRPPAVVAERQLEVRGGIGVLELEAALERPRRVPRLTEVVVGEAEIEVGPRVVGGGLQEVEAAVAHAFGAVEVQLAAA